MQILGIYAIILALVSAIAYFKGHEDGSVGQSEALTECRTSQKILDKQLSEAHDATRKAGQAVGATITESVRGQTKSIQGVVDNAIKEIDAARKGDNGKCVLPGSFRVWHDFAAKANGVAPTSGFNVSADPVDCFTFVETVVKNYGSCNKNASRQQGLRDYTERTTKLINEAKEPKEPR